jgi:hypothetical protein
VAAYRAARDCGLNPAGFFAIQAANFRHLRMAAQLLQAVPVRVRAAFSVSTAWICEWHGRQMPTVTFTAVRANSRLFRLLWWRVRGIR